MPSPLAECVLNFSEGQDLSLVEEIVDAVKSAKVIDLHSDPDHNRSVVTFIGTPGEVKAGAFSLTERAIQLLDIREHTGVHPFIGVVDVIPFIPLRGCDRREMVGLAWHLGEELWSKLKLPVFFYGEAARRKERQDLSYVRHGGYQALRQEIDQPHRQPDIGHGFHVTAGATAVGARDFLIAFNVNLQTRELDVARSIAKNIREKSGGLPGVRALGVELQSRGITQVTINVVDHQKTSLKQVYDEVHKWAKEYQVGIIESEIVGLIPAAAVFDGMGNHLKLKNLAESIILDNHL